MSRGAVAEYLAKQFNGDVESPDSTVVVGTTPVEVAGGDGERVQLTLVNLSANTIYIAPTPAVSASRGIFLGANGGSVTMSVVEDGILPSLQWYALATAAASSLYVIRVRRYTIAAPQGG